MTNNNILFEMSMLCDDYSFDFLKIIIDMLPFKAKKMSPAAIHKTQNFNEDIFYSKLLDALKRKVRFSASVSQDFNNSFTLRYDDISDVITIIVFWEDCTDEGDFLNKIDALLNDTIIINASFRDHEDGLLSTAYKISSYERRGIDTSNFKKKVNTPFKEEIIDIEQFSGHSHEYGGIQFTSTYIMWFGKDFFKFVPKEILTSFKDCFSNETFENGTVRIQLYENINDYNSEEADQRQWAFRKHTNIDKVADDWDSDYRKLAARNKSGANMVIEQGNFEHGGVKLIKMYLDKNRKPTPQKLASIMIIREYNSQNQIIYESEVNI